MSKECTTHHHACDCREEKFRQLEQENAKLRENFMAAESEIILLREEREELRADKERLDWLLTDDGGFWVNWMYEYDEWTPKLKASRDAIDAAKRRGHE